MKLLNRKDFLALDGEWLFSKYEPFVFGDLTIKIENFGDNDFITQQIVDAVACTGTEDFIDKLNNAETNDINMDFYNEGRDGCLDKDQLFAVWSKDDVKALIDRLQKVLDN